MRKYHRWLAVVFGVFLFWIALTGFGTQIVILTLGDPDHDEAEAAPDARAGTFALVSPAQAHEGEKHEPETPVDLEAAGAPAGFACPENWTCAPQAAPEENEAAEALEFLRHLHSGEAFGPVGTWISIASGLALLFFAFSGIWMYLQMWRGRRAGAKAGLFWG